AGTGPGRVNPPSRVAGVRRQVERFIATEVECEIDRERLARQLRRVDPREEAAPAVASAARLQPQRLTVGSDLRVRAEPARIAEAEAQIGAGEVHRCRIDSGAGEIGRESEARLPS